MMGSTTFGDLYWSAMGKAARLAVKRTEVEPSAVRNEPGPVKKLRTVRGPGPSHFEIISAKDAETKTLLAEVAKNLHRQGDAHVLRLEAGAKVQEENVVRRMSRLYEEVRQQRNEMIQKHLPSTLIRKPAPLDAFAENRAKERSAKVQENLVKAKMKTMEKKRLIEMGISREEAFKKTYFQFMQFLSDSPEKKNLLETVSPFIETLDSAVKFFKTFVEKIKSGDIQNDDLKNADVALSNTKDILNLTVAESEKIEAKKKAEKERLKLEEAKKETENKFSDAKSLKIFSELRQLLHKTREDLQPLIADKKMDQYRFQLQKAATLPVNAISADSPQHMLDKYRKLCALLTGEKIESVTSRDHPLGGLFVMELLARLFVNQAEKAVSSKPDAAYPLASILVNLWTEFPDFGLLVKACFWEKCPYLVPAFLPRIQGQTDEEYFRAMGYQIRNDKIEDHEMFLKRMEGIMRLYAAVMIVRPRKVSATTPLGLAEAWRWSAAFLNLEPRPDISPVLLVAFLEVTGHAMFTAYGQQFKKMLAYVCKDYLPRLEKNTPKNRRGPLSRFETFLEQVVKSGSIGRPVELLPTGFW